MSLLAPDYSLLAMIAAFVAGVVVGRLTGAGADPRRREERRAVRSSPPTSAAHIIQLLPAETRIEIETLVADDRKIEAIRVCRATLGLDLQEAKDAVDLIERTSGRGARAP